MTGISAISFGSNNLELIKNSITNKNVENEKANFAPNSLKTNYNSNISKQISAPSFSGKCTDRKAAGKFADKNFDVECSNGLISRSVSGTIDDLDFKIKHSGKFFKADTLTGSIGNKDLNLTVKEGFAKKTIKGSLGDEPIDLKVTETFTGYRIKGKFKNKDINIKLDSKLNGYSLKSDNMSLSIKDKSLFSSDVRVKGTYNEDTELIPILLDTMYSLNDEEMATLMLFV
jgi:hypothetical protein